MATTVTAAPKTKTAGRKFFCSKITTWTTLFTPEDFNEDQQMIAKLTDEFAVNELLPP